MKSINLLITFCMPLLALGQNKKIKSINVAVNKNLKSVNNQFILLDSTKVSFVYNGQPVTYGVIVSSKTGRQWLDRNLGAKQVANSLTDSLAFGDLFQWGRGADGHQIRTSAITKSLCNSDIPENTSFIIPASHPRDWRVPQNDNLWKDSNGVNNPCPKGWRLPTREEFDAEYISDINGGFNQLKLVLAGYRSRLTGDLEGMFTQGFYWTSSPSPTTSIAFTLSSKLTGTSGSDRALGCSVRCIRLFQKY